MQALKHTMQYRVDCFILNNLNFNLSKIIKQKSKSSTLRVTFSWIKFDGLSPFNYST